MYYVVPIFFVLLIVYVLKRRKIDSEAPDVERAKKMVGGKSNRKANRFPRW
jgi:hypothetical protein